MAVRLMAQAVVPGKWLKEFEIKREGSVGGRRGEANEGP